MMTASSFPPAAPCTPLDVSILIPAYNEAEGIQRVIGDLHNMLRHWEGTSEVIVVDDGSTDRTGDLARALGCRVLWQPVRRGYGAAIKLGMSAASGRYLAILDADGSYSASDLVRLLRHVPGRDMVSGIRDREWGRWVPMRRLAKWLLRMIAQWGTGRRIQDPNSGLKIFRRDVACAVVPWLPDGFSCSTSLLMAFLFCGYSVHYEPIQYRPRVGRSKFRPLQDSWNYLRTVLKFVHAFRPWRLYFPVAIAALLAALLVAGVAPAERRLAQPGFLLLCGVALAAIFLGFYQQRRACQNRVAVQTHVDAARRSA